MASPATTVTEYCGLIARSRLLTEAEVAAHKARWLADNPDAPRLSFIEKNCVQCGLCATTCPEDAITLVPRLLLADAGKARRQPRVLNEVEPYRCIRCAKPFGTLRAIEAMMSRLSGHSMFQGASAERLRMCGDCQMRPPPWRSRRLCSSSWLRTKFSSKVPKRKKDGATRHTMAPGSACGRPS